MTWRFWFGINRYTIYYKTSIFTVQYIITNLNEIDPKTILNGLVKDHIFDYINSEEIYYTRYVGLEERINNSFTTIYQMESNNLSFEKLFKFLIEYLNHQSIQSETRDSSVI
jgi:hypothetical protein